MKMFLKLVMNVAFITTMFVNVSLAAELSADELVKRTADDVLNTIKSDKDIQAGDQKKIFALAEEKILPNFDFDRVCRMVLGKNWRSATPEQQAAFQKEFRTLLLRTYATALGKYKDQVIEYKPMRAEAGAKNVSVKTQILQPGGQPISVDYSLVKAENGWKVYDIVIESVSLVTNYRSQFSSEIRQNGLDSLNKKLADKNKASGV
ncbi:MAG: toluene tolerance protein [Methylotenera sp.]|jgi:phospholipid transport system substrate-binding protein|uniref:ABC transporter substrate-binding protein n=1 Tax=Methylotenera mobilis TaxID=359408 RepID=A0A351R8S5_9PROT|nr:ABC transporter substrate-binding protein [Methylotenera mobilis]PPC93043.1 MAG: toluene tolerance protein [Methylotenera sp.]PPC96739.1 MAG: toluene tolerance protein [Methylotenera sp.]PPD47394.1 MAG: toluene tolerance protein [Methylotenera sp.]HBA08446.1 ABC transporter substrate-binding protein [Methylotenera mobilis]